MAVLEFDALTAGYRIGNRWHPAVRELSLNVEAGQVVGLVGESGSGKSTAALAAMRSLGHNGRVLGGSVRFEGLDLWKTGEAEMRSIWGRRLAFVPQNPASALNPSIPAGEQIAETFRLHLGLSRADAAVRVRELLLELRIHNPERVAQRYPHQLSGGMQQRVMIALAVGAHPAMLVLDEPTTNLDASTEAAILENLQSLIRQRQTSVLYVTHNLRLAGRICDRVGVLYAGELVEEAPASELLLAPLHPYTAGLVGSLPQPGTHRRSGPLPSMAGRVPALTEAREGCVFAPRCPLAIEICHQHPALESTGDGRLVRCHRWQEIAAGQLQPWAAPARPVHLRMKSSRAPADEPVLRVRSLEVGFKPNFTPADLLGLRPRPRVEAVAGVDLDLDRGAVVGLVGESGSGKTTFARAITGLVARAGGSVSLLGEDLPPGLSGRGLDTLRRIQYVFQDPSEVFNPHMTIGESLRRPLMRLGRPRREPDAEVGRKLRGWSRRESDAEVGRLLRAVRLPETLANRYPEQLSGGEKQRAAIARAFSVSPDLLIADEAVSSLDVSVQASILNLFSELQAEFDNALLFISHDLAVISYLADVVAVMYAGRWMQVSPGEVLFEPPHHPYFQALLAAITGEKSRPGLNSWLEPDGDTEEGVRPSGCPYFSRCPRRIEDLCREATPPWQLTPDGKRIFCHIPLDQLIIEEAGPWGS